MLNFQHSLFRRSSYESDSTLVEESNFTTFITPKPITHHPLASKIHISAQLSRFINFGFVTPKELTDILSQALYDLRSIIENSALSSTRCFVIATSKDKGGMAQDIISSFGFRKIQIYSLSVKESYGGLRYMNTVEELENELGIVLLTHAKDLMRETSKTVSSMPTNLIL